MADVKSLLQYWAGCRLDQPVVLVMTSDRNLVQVEGRARNFIQTHGFLDRDYGVVCSTRYPGFNFVPCVPLAELTLFDKANEAFHDARRAGLRVHVIAGQ